MPRWPTGSFDTHRTGCYGCMRFSPSDGACGVHDYPCTHYGMDLFASSPEVVAPEAGVVVAVSNGKTAPWVGYGPGVVVIHGDSGVYILLAHLNPSTIAVGNGARVTEGERIADFDRAIGHTHFEVRRELTGPSSSNTMDPVMWVEGIGRKLLTIALLGFVAWGSWRLFRDDLV